MSDGESALRSVQAHEQKKKRGPENHTLSHWNEPKATVDHKSKLQWLFKCRYCDQIRTFPRTLKDGIGHQLQYNNEPHKPKLGNLATHTKEHAGLIAQREAEKSGNDGRLTSTKLMEKYIQDGLLNPRIEPTQSGFTRLFVAWLVEHDLPFTTAVRKSVAQIFTDLRSTIVREIHAIDAWLFKFEELRSLLLTSREWDLLGQYKELLECFTEVTAVMSHSSIPMLPWVLPMYELMRVHLITFMDDAEWLLAIREAACAGHEKLMHY
ncbi:hypothetical protein EDB83DRAFT_2234018 [Lactarius deliciosus]|nr:hypothetical protein EDB83DRAFT_2234018 [Lactarius deliciosus]